MMILKGQNSNFGYKNGKNFLDKIANISLIVKFFLERKRGLKLLNPNVLFA